MSAWPAVTGGGEGWSDREANGRESDQSEIVRGYETATGTLIPVSDEDLDNLPQAKAIGIVAFVPAESIDPDQVGASYYLAAEGVARREFCSDRAHEPRGIPCPRPPGGRLGG